MALDLLAARAAIERHCRRTPLVAAPALGNGVWLKLECLQRTGSFKLRGACAALASTSAREVVTASAGNHGLGIALAARALARRATVFVPETTPAVKRDGIAALGTEVRVAGTGYDHAEAAARAWAAERSLPFVSPYDDEAVIFGNGGTTGEEILSQRPEVAQVVTPIGGGGLAAGLLGALAGRGVVLAGVQPAQNCAMAESLRLGRALTRYTGGPTLCEGLEGAVGERTYRALAAAGVEITLVDDAAVRRAIGFAYREIGLVLEPSAAIGLAALREGLLEPRSPCVVIATGANIEPDLLDQVLRQ
ncbi:MAG TPA: pyridoxal-phosphate dependent enzyme [Polyangia bacterium]|nr:pyridoxal-phosphate dependent enzyme [Polyangia bacterium]